MGRRHHNHRFLPGEYVFPGGRVERDRDVLVVVARRRVRPGWMAQLPRPARPRRGPLPLQPCVKLTKKPACCWAAS